MTREAIELVRLPRGLDAVSLEVARPPEGELTALADGDVVEAVERPLADALAEPEPRARTVSGVRREAR